MAAWPGWEAQGQGNPTQILGVSWTRERQHTQALQPLLWPELQENSWPQSRRFILFLAVMQVGMWSCLSCLQVIWTSHHLPGVHRAKRARLDVSRSVGRKQEEHRCGGDAEEKDVHHEANEGPTKDPQALNWQCILWGLNGTGGLGAFQPPLLCRWPRTFWPRMSLCQLSWTQQRSTRPSQRWSLPLSVANLSGEMSTTGTTKMSTTTSSDPSMAGWSTDAPWVPMVVGSPSEGFTPSYILIRCTRSSTTLLLRVSDYPKHTGFPWTGERAWPSQTFPMRYSMR